MNNDVVKILENTRDELDKICMDLTFSDNLEHENEQEIRDIGSLSHYVSDLLSNYSSGTLEQYKS